MGTVVEISTDKEELPMGSPGGEMRQRRATHRKKIEFTQDSKENIRSSDVLPLNITQGKELFVV
ncbi:hypothetical protein DPMN_043848 [Dreissena polymorpha]|uniref:Uncharacterized protein n=1 Tax=Dreissena polymorpha TaxID=45954 RepID=A0A9D4D270_DREPO|nr:hypothetical protein DPMN_043848 [Dreissena polymorpha]